MDGLARRCLGEDTPSHRPLAIPSSGQAIHLAGHQAWAGSPSSGGQMSWGHRVRGNPEADYE